MQPLLIVDKALCVLLTMRNNNNIFILSPKSTSSTQCSKTNQVGWNMLSVSLQEADPLKASCESRLWLWSTNTVPRNTRTTHLTNRKIKPATHHFAIVQNEAAACQRPRGLVRVVKGSEAVGWRHFLYLTVVGTFHGSAGSSLYSEDTEVKEWDLLKWLNPNMIIHALKSGGFVRL